MSMIAVFTEKVSTLINVGVKWLTLWSVWLVLIFCAPPMSLSHHLNWVNQCVHSTSNWAFPRLFFRVGSDWDTTVQLHYGWARDSIRERQLVFTNINSRNHTALLKERKHTMNAFHDSLPSAVNKWLSLANTLWLQQSKTRSTVPFPSALLSPISLSSCHLLLIPHFFCKPNLVG